METPSNRITINIGGVRFETYSSTLQTFPGTKLSSLSEPHACSTYSFNPKLQEFLFDRNAKVFASVLEYYRTGRLHFPSDICRSVFLEELEFWEISDSQLAQCCWLKLHSKDSNLEDFGRWFETNRTDTQGLISTTGSADFSWRARWQPKIWPLLHNPSSSVAAMCVALVSLLITIAAVALFFEENKEQFHYEVVNYTSQYMLEKFSEEEFVFSGSFLLYVELLCVLWFIADFSLRLVFCPDKTFFLKDPLNFVDLISLFPVFIELCLIGHPKPLKAMWIVLGLMRLTYIIKLLRFFKLLGESLILRVLSGSLASIFREILILLFVLVCETLFYGTLMFYAESYLIEAQFFSETQFVDIYSTWWWAVVTLTTVGYGDLIPIGTYGKVVAALTAISGIFTIVIPIPILFIKFQHYYSIAVAHEKLKVNRNASSQ